MNEIEIAHSVFRDTPLGSAIACSIVFIVYLLITRSFDAAKQKNKNKPIIEMGNSIKTMGANIEVLNSTLIKFIQDNTKRDKERCRITIELSFINFKWVIFEECSRIIRDNNIQRNKHVISSNLNQLINATYFRIYSNLSLYEFNGKNISQHCKPIWKEEVYNDVIELIYNGEEEDVRINSIKNKLGIKSQDYSQYIYNKTFND